MSDVHFSKKGDRALTPFVGQELLYDYIIGILDEERVKALEKLISENRELKVELDKIRDGLEYVRLLQQTNVSATLLERIRTPSTYLHVLVQKTRFTEWPEGVKTAVEGGVIALGALILIMVIPWTRLLSWKTELEKTSVTLSEVSKSRHEDPDSDVSPRTQEVASAGIMFEDETQVKPVATPTPEPLKVAEKTEKKEASKTPAKPAATPAPAVETSAGISASAPDSGKKQGIIFRGTIGVTNVDGTTPKLVEFINSVGGRKAGEVELGWKKGSGSYFHLTIPEAKYKSLVDFFNEYGTLKIQKEPHPRVMPDGIIRLIITVDEKG